MRAQPLSSRAARISLVAALSLLNACASPKDFFYTLNTAAPEPAQADTVRTGAGSAKQGPQYSVAVGPVRVPEIVDRPQFVLRRGPNQVELSEQHRWAQSLRAEIADAVAGNLERLLPQARAISGNGAAGQNADYRVALNVEQFDAAPGTGVTVRAAWTLRDAAGGAGRTGEALVSEPVAGAGYDALAAGFSRAVARMSAQIAEALDALQKNKGR